MHDRQINIRLLFAHVILVLFIWNTLQRSTRIVIIGVDSIYVWSDDTPGCFKRFCDKYEAKSIGKRSIQETVCRSVG